RKGVAPEHVAGAKQSTGQAACGVAVGQVAGSAGQRIASGPDHGAAGADRAIGGRAADPIGRAGACKEFNRPTICQAAERRFANALNLKPENQRLFTGLIRPAQYRRLAWMVLLLVIAFAGLGYRLVELQVVRHEDLSREAAGRRERTLI